jgi:hypothetical protein
MQAGFGFGELSASAELAIAALNPSFQAAASLAKHGVPEVPIFLKKNIFLNPLLKNNNALYLGRVSSSFATSTANALGKLAPALTGVAIVTNGIDIFRDGQLTAGDAFVAINTTLQIAFPVYGVLYGVADLGSSLIFGQSITGAIKSGIDSNVSGGLKLGY